ncbi:MAG TPA: M15 family metallopeptidase [Pseudolabrys sp.]|nr:M15 family metallopeptidase [Pseudolabrys sp.]
MGKFVFSHFILLVALGTSTSRADESYGAAPKDIGQHLDALVSAYPDRIAGHDSAFVILKNGMKFAVSDGRTDKTFKELLEKPDVDDMFYARYPAGMPPGPVAKNVDPGRVRFEPLFVAMYGDCGRNEVVGTLRAIDWLPRHRGGSIAVTAVNGVADALQRVSHELDQLPARHMKYLLPLAGSYNCRPVAGSRARSMHAYGAAIDINTRYASYWRWAAPRASPQWQNRIPAEIVQIFEKHGFIWGGRWHHYDTMHFEYRPELLGGKRTSGN